MRQTSKPMTLTARSPGPRRGIFMIERKRTVGTGQAEDRRHAAGMDHLAQAKAVDHAARFRQIRHDPRSSRNARRSGSPAARIFRDRGTDVVGHAKERQPLAFGVEERVAGRVVAVPRLAGRADDGEPSVVLRGRESAFPGPAGTASAFRSRPCNRASARARGRRRCSPRAARMLSPASRRPLT